ncbi:uncharacterized protein RHOBADRAFT_56205 [Rhodotorula graminis WP1]|uniref:Membrane insertase YidC/Oxa/ALB C-terminal domain-containing protein n=1 Tax=Rhodotorula graminis (strain WP1) TaxID=578459 RepID=A0A0P9GGR7_RHOGW|nr:uncharacterized protein RHOBADRAFT_56205 [Rhodotorula graminis WP1]KPV72078.1 hypothetical protein RHOBADRAFT_56205 [Rhodotorula graminis WP1]
MATGAPARALRTALVRPQRPHLAAFLHARSPASPLASSRPSLPSPFAPAFASTRRTFASTAPASAWFPSFGAAKPAPAAPVDAADAPRSFVDEPSTAAAVAAEPAQAGAVPLPPTPAPVEAAAPVPAAAPADEAAAGAVQNVYDGIATGSLDLSSLVGSFGPHPIMRLQSLFLHLHESFPLLGHPGVQWALVIPAVTLFLRLLLFPFQVRAQSNAARMAIIQPEMLKGMNKLKDAKARNDFHAMQAAQMETQALMKKHDVNPIRNLVFPLAQAAVFMCMFFALRGLANAGIVSMSTEGFGWVQDLTQPDPYYLLPVTSTALTLATLETGVDSSTQVQTSTTKNMKMIFRVLLVGALPFIAYFPAALLIYWTTNNFLSLVQSTLLKTPFMRSLLSIPTPPPKPQPGDANYVPEPSFSEAFKNMQVGAKEKWQETQDNARKQAELDSRFKSLGQQRAEVYTPRKPRARDVTPGGVQQVAAELLETGSTEKPAVIRAERVGDAEAERARRVAEARRRRLAGRK